MQAAKHWDILAKDVANEVAVFLNGHDAAIAADKGVCVVQKPGVFGQAFSKLLVPHLLAAGLKVKDKTDGCLSLQFETQLIRHDANRKNTMWGLGTLLATGIYAIRDVHDYLYANWYLDWLIPAGVAADVISGSVAQLSKHEILITTSIINENQYLMSKTDLYYINDRDWWHYPEQEGPRKNPAKKFKVEG
jgi:hypothetical protein